MLLTAAYLPVLRAHEGHEHDAPASESDIQAALKKLSAADLKLATAQRFCATMTRDRLGAMGTPVKVVIEGKPVFLCCESCREQALENPKATLKTVEQLKKSTAALAKLSATDRKLAETQAMCPIGDGRLGLMGTPVRVDLQGQAVFLCCKGCVKKAVAEPAATLAKVRELREAAHEEHQH
ncbi:MAG: hypothetical protein K2Y37_25120 [Pirellulales bacterium]|nr:hypothetical protein [Pirellulales bacterium]